jgi:hypothetical protein
MRSMAWRTVHVDGTHATSALGTRKKAMFIRRSSAGEG